MIVKVLEIRDRNTFIPAAAIKMVPENDAQRWLMARVGFREGTQVTLMRLNDQKAHADPYDWGATERTMPNAHVYIERMFDQLRDGDVVDVEFILGETQRAKESERLHPFGAPDNPFDEPPTAA